MPLDLRLERSVLSCNDSFTVKESVHFCSRGDAAVFSYRMQRPVAVLSGHVQSVL